MKIKKIHIDLDAIKEKFRVFITPGGLFSILYFTKALGIGPTAPNALLVLAALAILGFSFREKIEFHYKVWPLWALLIWIPISTIIARPDPCFKSFQRYIFFLLIILVISPAITNSFLEKVRRDAFEVFCKLAVVFSVASFFAYFLGINYYYDFWGREGIEFYQNTPGQFGGFFCHSMILGPIAVIAAIILLTRYVSTKKIVYLICLICCAGACAFSASRASFGGLILSLIVVLSKMIKERRVLVKVIIGSIAALTISFPLWIGSLSMLRQKQSTNIEQGSLFSSRSEKIPYRLIEIKENPVFGVGFAAIDPKVGDGFVESTGTIEPGSSWLCIASMTGLVGFVLFVIFYVGCRVSIKNMTLGIFPILSSMLLFLGLHMVVEGYVFSIGNSLCFSVWQLTGVCFLKEYDICLI